jgi:hypothetical protein
LPVLQRKEGGERTVSVLLGCANGTNTVDGPVDDWRVGLASPPIGELDHEPWPWRAPGHGQHVVQNCALLGDVPRLTQGVPKGPVQVEHARRPRCLGNLLDERKTDRRHARRLDFSCQQSHGPRADRSGGDEEHEVNVRVGQPAPDRPSGGEQLFRTPAQAESKVLVCNPTDDTLCLELTQALQREDEVDIA